MTFIGKTIQIIGFSVLGTGLLAQTLDLSVTSADGTMTDLSLNELDQLEQTEFSTSTIWTDNDISFQGVALSTVLGHINAVGSVVTMTALNDYSVEIPFDEIGEEYPIIATRMNGDTMPVRDKGPYWVVFPYDFDEDFQTETTYARSIWQLKSLDVTE